MSLNFIKKINFLKIKIWCWWSLKVSIQNEHDSIKKQYIKIFLKTCLIILKFELKQLFFNNI